MSGIPLILMFVVAIVVMILAISKLKISPFFAIMAVAILFGVAAGIPLSQIPGHVGTGFSSIFTSIGLVIIFGALIGTILEATGGAIKIADMIIKLIGRRNPTLSFMIMGWIVSVPVFCDSGFVILNPVRKSTVKRTGASSVATAVGLSTGLYASHVLVPLTPGPLAASNTLGLGDQLLLVIAVATVVSIPSLIGAYFYAIWIGRREKSQEDLEIAKDATVKTYEQLVAEYGRLPSGLVAISPILVPILLMALGSIAGTTIAEDAAGGAAMTRMLLIFFGTPVIALMLGFLVAVLQLLNAKKIAEFNPIADKTLRTIAPILFITGSGAVLGRIINFSGMIEFITGNADALARMGLFFPFLLSAIIKTAQGSSTVAMITTASVMYPMMAVLGLDSTMMTALTVMAIGAGSMVVSHANDSYFWVVANLSGMSPQQGYKSHTAITLVQGISCMIGIFVFSLFVS